MEINDRNLNVLNFSMNKNDLLVLNDFTILKSEEDINGNINLLSYFIANSEEYLMCLNDSNKLFISSIGQSRVISKISFIPQQIMANKFSLISFARINYDSNNANSLAFSIGTSNGLIFFNSLNLQQLTGFKNNLNDNNNCNSISYDNYAYKNISEIHCLERSAKGYYQLNGIFSVFMNFYFDIEEILSDTNTKHSKSSFAVTNPGSLYNYYNLVNDFLNKNSLKNTEPINCMVFKDNILFAGLNSFVLKYNLKLNLLTQIMPCLGAINNIMIENENIYVSGNSRILLLYECRGVLKSKIETTFNCIYELQKLQIKNKNVF